MVNFPENVSPEVPFERDQNAPFRPGPREHLSIERSRHRLGCGENVMTGRAQRLNARERDVLVARSRTSRNAGKLAKQANGITVSSDSCSS